jgi:predicted Rossmann fold flavoprotein
VEGKHIYGILQKNGTNYHGKRFLMSKYDAIILGGGAAGLFCAARLGQKGQKVLILEGNREVGRKILVSGGGRCNFSNRFTSPGHFISDNPDFVRSALALWSASNTLAWVTEAGIEVEKKKDGRFFCRQQSRELLELLLKDCRKGKVEILTGLFLKKEEISFSKDLFKVRTKREVFWAPRLLVATGGISFRKLGATALGYELAKKFSLSLIERSPALVPLLFSEAEKKRYASLAGLSFRARVRHGKQCFEDDILFTHQGLSGPAILQISSYMNDDLKLLLNCLPNLDLQDVLKKVGKEDREKNIINFLSRFLPRRFLKQRLSEEALFKVKQLNEKQKKEIIRKIQCWEILFKKKAGYSRAEVTRGGVDTRELSSKNMEVKKRKGLYFIGEVLDVTGELGGYNFQWAFSSAYAAAKSILS